MTKRSATARPYPVRVPQVAVGPLVPSVLEECSLWFAAKRYSPGSTAAVVSLAKRLSAWMQEVDAGVCEIDGELLDRFVTAEGSRDLPCGSANRSMGALHRFLADSGYLRVAEINDGPVTSAQAAVMEWRSWMRVERGLCRVSGFPRQVMVWC